jgi:hypothetical protein
MVNLSPKRLVQQLTVNLLLDQNQSKKSDSKLPIKKTFQRKTSVGWQMDKTQLK